MLLCPHTNGSALYHKLELCVHNFPFYDIVSKNYTCYVWHECEGGLPDKEFTSCVLDYICSDLTPSGYVIYSDGCTYQNRNVTMSSAILFFIVRNNKVVTQIILEKGQTQMEVDSVHSVIERHLQGKTFFFHSEYATIIAEARINPCS